MRDNLSIEGLRVILFLSIFLFHAWGMMFPLGWAAIDTFLVITAFFLTKKWLQRPQNEVHIKEALIKRAERLYSPYVFVVVTMTALYAVTKHHLPGDFFSYFLFAQNFQQAFVVGATQVPFVGHFWYLTLDFYLVLIWLVLFKYIRKRHLKAAFIILLLFSVTYRSIVTLHFSKYYLLSYTMPWGMMDTFAAGGLLAIIENEGKRTRLPWYALIFGVLGIGICIYSTSMRYDTDFLHAMSFYRSPGNYADNPITIQIHFAIILVSFFLVWICSIKRKHYNVLSNSTLARIGGGAYELYVFHYPIICGLKAFTTNRWIVIGLGLVLTIIVTWIWKLIIVRYHEVLIGTRIGETI